MKKIRQKDIATEAGVSPSTVSLLLKDPNTMRVSAETRDRIYSIMRKHQYSGSPNRHLGDIACIYPNYIMQSVLAEFFYGSLFLSVEQAGQRFGHTVRLRSYNSFEELSPLIRDPSVAGIISINSSQPANELNCQKPIIAVNSVYTSACDVVQSHQRGSARDQMALLCRHGHRRIAFFSIMYPPNPMTAPTEQSEIYAERFSGYCEGLFQNDLPIREEYCCTEKQSANTQNPMEPARKVLNHLLNLPEPPSAILAFNDCQAVALMRVAKELGIQIPQDLSIVGNDNVEEGRFCSPALTTAEQDRVALGQVAVERLVQRLDNNYQGPFQRITIPLKLIERDSVSAPRS